MSARRFLFLALLISLLAMHSSARAEPPVGGACYAVPTSIDFQGYLVDEFGSPVTTSTSSPLPMRFGIYINNCRVWYAQYSGVDVIGGSFTVHLGGDPAVAIGLDPQT